MSERCTANNKRGTRCERPAIPGAVVCRYHGGGAPQVKRKAAERLLERQVRATLADIGEDVEPLEDPYAALMDVATQAKAFADVMKAKVAELTKVGYSSAQGLEQTKAEVQVYLSALTRAESVLKSIIGLDLEGRRVRLEEAKASLVASALARVVSDNRLGLDPERQRLARSLLAKELGAPAPAIEVVTTPRASAGARPAVG